MSLFSLNANEVKVTATLKWNGGETEFIVSSMWEGREREREVELTLKERGRESIMQCLYVDGSNSINQLEF